jgi:hypothetical protein
MLLSWGRGWIINRGTRRCTRRSTRTRCPFLTRYDRYLCILDRNGFIEFIASELRAHDDIESEIARVGLFGARKLRNDLALTFEGVVECGQANIKCSKLKRSV